MEHHHHDHAMMASVTTLENPLGMAEDSSSDFCHSGMGGGMVMYMDGFRWALKQGNPCLNLFFKSWTLNTRTRVIWAMIFVVLLGMLVEAISTWRHRLARHARKESQSMSSRQAYLIRTYQTSLHGFHALTGYILMLATMTYSYELILSVVAGIVLGYLSFGGDTYRHATPNPCCAFLENEEEDRASRWASSDGSLGSDVQNCCEGNNDDMNEPLLVGNANGRNSSGRGRESTGLDA